LLDRLFSGEGRRESSDDEITGLQHGDMAITAKRQVADLEARIGHGSPFDCGLATDWSAALKRNVITFSQRIMRKQPGCFPKKEKTVEKAQAGPIAISFCGQAKGTRFFTLCHPAGFFRPVMSHRKAGEDA